VVNPPRPKGVAMEALLKIGLLVGAWLILVKLVLPSLGGG
jgi:hypothetical protein